MKSKTRLKLDFALTTAEERTNFINNYLANIKFTPTQEELEMCGNYLLWGKDQDGKNQTQKKNVIIPTKSGLWDNHAEEESLDALVESPAFCEANITPLNNCARPLIRKEVFSREEALTRAPNDLVKKTFIDLFRRIDEAEATIGLYELSVGKRTKPLRQSLMKNFSDKELEKLRIKAIGLNNYSYLKLRHHLVELRQEQYTISETYRERVLCHQERHATQLAATPTFNNEIVVKPLGIKIDREQAKLLFKPFKDIVPQAYNKEELKILSDYMWKEIDKAGPHTFDFREHEHVYQLLLGYKDIVGEEVEHLDGTLAATINTLWFYIENAGLNEAQMVILKMKIAGRPNQEIAERVNKEFGKSYTINYISTIFCQKIVNSICTAAEYHLKLVQSVFFKDEFKTCTKCGRTLLRDSSNFVKKSRAKDGLTSRCKLCDKEDRKRKKG